MSSAAVRSHSGAHLGNYPQAFTHIGLVDCGLRLARHAARESNHCGPPPASTTTRGDHP